ncbi:MAG TPA: lipopolysaccharide assembly protein LapA domain-containing protein [Balneolales bacterium]|nr:lipopolysaccharide assembly protein LapA domain-containing protein [Balneolales bacterium]
MKTWKIITALVLVIVSLIIVLQNTAAVATKFLFFTLVMPRALLLFLTLLIGVILGILATYYWQRRSGISAKDSDSL